MMHPILYLMDTVLSMTNSVITIWFVMSWLGALGVINVHNNTIRMILNVLEKTIEPLLTFVRRYIPTISGIDLSPIVLVLGIHVLQYTLNYYFS